MSTVLGLFGSGGGGGEIYITNPFHLPRTLVAGGRLYYKKSITTLNSIQDNNGYGTIMDGPGNMATVEAVTDDTYVTLLDITGSGFMNTLVGLGANTGTTSTIKITVDGTVYNMIHDYAGVAGSKLLIGSYLNTIGNTSQTTNYDPLNSSVSYGFYDGFTLSDTTNNNYGMNVENKLLIPSYVSEAIGLPRLRFNESIKIEVKQNTIYSSGISSKAFVQYTLG